VKPLWSAWLGRMGYQAAWDLQRDLAAHRASAEIPDYLLTLEHDPVYTLGKRTADTDVLLDQAALKNKGIDVVRTDRGGLATYHGPGQVIGYPILDLGPAADVVAHVCALEQALIDTAADFGATALRIDGLRGVWVGDSKLAAIGVHVSRGITTHGFALNVDPDLSAFNGIVPCGILDKGVTSLRTLTGTSAGVEEVADHAARHLARCLDRDLVERAHV